MASVGGAVRLCGGVAIALLVSVGRPAAGARIADSTPVPVRLLGLINSETSRPGQPLSFVVASDVVVDGEVVITKGTPASGEVVRAKRMKWGFLQHKPKLAFRFTQTTTASGRVISLRASPQRDGGDGHVPNRTASHSFLWAGGADVFEAYVDGDYEM